MLTVLQDPVYDLVNGDGLSYQEPEPNLVITPSHTLDLLLGTLLSIPSLQVNENLAVASD